MDGLTTTQTFELERMKRDVEKLSRERKIELITQSYRLTLVKKNLINNRFNTEKAFNLPLSQQFNIRATEERIQKNTNQELSDILIKFMEDLMRLDTDIRNGLKNMLGE